MELAKKIKRAKRVWLCGNGGSAANAIHIANDLVACGVRAQALTADVATLTRIANDVSYGAVFSHQLRVLADPGDLLIALSGSGRSANIVEALDEARKMRMDTYSVFGEFSGIKGDCNEGQDMQSAERFQITLGHRLYKCLKGY